LLRRGLADGQEKVRGKVLTNILYKIVLVNRDEMRHDASVT
jgi:hypothetical protein